MKNKFMMIRATEEEKNLAKLKAKEMGMGLSAFIRFLIKQWGSSTNTTDKPHIKRESRFWGVFDILYALYLRVVRR